MKNYSILTYHKVDYNIELGLTRVTPEQFYSQIKFLTKKNFILTTLSDLVFNTEDTNSSGKIALTFDDSYDGVYKYAFPILKEFNAKATIFVITDYIGRENDWDVNLGWRKFKHASFNELTEMSEYGFEIGSHTKTHRNLVTLPAETQRTEIIDSRRMLIRNFKCKINFISYPFGKFNQDVIKISKQAGYLGACIFYPLNKPHFDGSDEYILKRTAVYRIDNISAIKSKVGINRFKFIEILKQNIISFCSTATIIVNYFKRPKKTS